METIRLNDEIQTLEGHLVVGHYSNGTVECQEFTIDENEEETLNGTRILTLHELAGIMKEVDGHNHDLVYEV